MAGEKDTWGNFLGGMAAETVLDPLNVISGKGILNALRARRGAQSANAGIRSANATSLAQRARGYLPEEAVEHISPLLKTADGTPKRMYHGTPESFDNYSLAHDSSENLFGKGVYTTDNPHVASEYASKEGGLRVSDGAMSVLQRHAAQVDPFDLQTLQSLNKGMGYLQRSPDPNPVLLKSNLGPVADRIGDDLVEEMPQNVRMQYLNVKKPFDMEALHPVSSLPSIKGGERLRDYLARHVDTHRDNVRFHTSRARNQKLAAGAVEPETADAIRRSFVQRNFPAGVTGDRYARYVEDATENMNSRTSGSNAIPKVLQKLGYDGITHAGGKRMGTIDHNVAIAFDPSQVYQPYIAKRLASELPVPSAPLGLATGTAAYNVAARGLRPPRRSMAE